MLEAAHAQLSVHRPCERLGLSRFSLYLEPAGETAENLRLRRLIDQEYTAHSFLGRRRMTAWLTEQEEEVRRLVVWLVWERLRPAEQGRGWSEWRRQHQAKARACHDKQRKARAPN